MPIVTIHDLPLVEASELNEEAELMVNNSPDQMVPANKVRVSALLSGVNTTLDNHTAQIANLDGDILETQTDLESLSSDVNDLTFLKSITGYDETKTQILKNVNGTFTWVDEA